MVALLQSEFWCANNFGGYDFSHENAPKFPEFFEALFCGSDKVPQKSRQISHKISLRQIQKLTQGDLSS